VLFETPVASDPTPPIVKVSVASSVVVPGRNVTDVVPTSVVPVCVKSMVYVWVGAAYNRLNQSRFTCLENGGTHAALNSVRADIGDVIVPGEGAPATPKGCKNEIVW
jgi:hypothetical protein